MAANKADLSKSKWEVSVDEINNFAASVGATWFETSAKLGIGNFVLILWFIR